MTIQVLAPAMGESISEAIVARWVKNEGDFVKEDELIAELETEKVNLEVTAPKAGKLGKILTPAGATVKVGQQMAEVDETATPSAGAAPAATAPSAPTATADQPTSSAPSVAVHATGNTESQSPAVRRLVEENAVNTDLVHGTGKDGRLTKGDILSHVADRASAPAAQAAAPAAASTAPRTSTAERENRIPMSRLRKTIAGRLKLAQNTAAMLTTYNEVDLDAVVRLRKDYKDAFEKKHGVKLGFMSFFVKAVVEGLKAWPDLNAEIDGEDLVYKNFYNIGVAVSTEKGLVVPVLRDADQMSLADIERNIIAYAKKGRDGKLMPDDMAGGSFTITNGGTFGSLMSMPILNYPQVGILGMHAIKERPVVVNGQIVIRPMMYLALTYDHRVVDGQGAVSFLVKIKEQLEDPSRMLLGV